MKSGLVIYSSSIDKMTDFYSSVFKLEIIEKDGSYALLTNEEFELVLLETETTKNISSFKNARESTPIKPTFFVSTPLEAIEQKIKEKSGFLYSPKDWKFGGRLVCDGHDCEGNIFQLRVKENA